MLTSVFADVRVLPYGQVQGYLPRNLRSIHGNVSHLTPSYPKSKVIFGVSGFQTYFFCYRINSENRLAPRNSKNTLFELIFAYLLHISLCLARKPSQPRSLAIPRNLTFRKSEKVTRDIRSCDWFLTWFSKAISLTAFHLSRSQLLLWTRAVLGIGIRRPMTPKTSFGKILAYFPRCFTSYPLVPQK